MPLHFTAAQSSRIRKSSGTQLSGRQSPFSRHSRAKPFRSPLGRTAFDSDNDIHSGYYKDSILPDIGPSQYISETTELNSVIQAIQYIRNTMFSDLPQRAGMNSTRIAEVLNFRRALPPIVSVAHVHMLLNAPTKVEREIVELVDSARVRKLFIPGRGFDSAGLGDCLILVQDWEDTTSAVAAGIFTPEETSSLVRAGFLVSPSSLAKHPSFDTSPTSIPASRRSHALNIVLPGQEIAVSDQRKSGISSMFLSIPNLGPYLRLVGAARTQIMTLLKKSRSGEAPLTLIRDRWDGAVESEVYYNVSKRARGESAGVLPGKTKKWKELYGMNFRWALEEALGSGLIELFDTGSVGPGVRRV
ncbi:conserved hypothetical protein [Histoplasma capsulatum var. duboisii H88]|uniref:Serine-threonine protein kinase 19 n=1 Tax=Ajellomyces capsulatus (strain H88) TaxID=544711 RepID=F0UBV0_AJEC8|nr:conserved hypothetical protein [Histoplasma capsulatum var. duboisii H88]